MSEGKITITPLRREDLAAIGWSGSPSHLEHVARALERVDAGEVDYLCLRLDGAPVVKTGIDQVRIAARGLLRVRLGVETDNDRAFRLYERLGYSVCGESPAEWEAEDETGRRFMYRTTCFEMVKQLR